MPTGLCLPYTASITRLVTMVGSANGRSMIASITPFPGKSSRTSTQPVARPKTRLMIVTATEMLSVTLKDSRARVRRHRKPKGLPTPADGLPSDRGQGQENDEREPEHRDSGAKRR